MTWILFCEISVLLFSICCRQAKVDIICPVPDTVANSYPILSPPYHFNQELQYQCRNGYELVGADIIRCQANESWSEPVPNCKAKTCDGPVAVIHGRISNVNTARMYTFTDVIEYECYQGYHISEGSWFRVCQDDGIWSNSPPICTENVRCAYLADCHKDARCILNKCQCLLGFGGNGTTCTAVDKCASDPCNVYADCSTLNGSARCVCRAGYHGDGTRTCTAVMCSSPPPLVNGTMTLATSKTAYSYSDVIAYACDLGYHRTTGTTNTRTCQANGTWSNTPPTCEDNVDCSNNNAICDGKATCASISNTMLRCQCKTGFDGDGASCEDIDECATKADNCNVHADCKNTVGSFNCTCKLGYQGSGISCVDVNECETVSCGKSTLCKNTMGSYACLCLSSYFRNGSKCIAYPRACYKSCKIKGSYGGKTNVTISGAACMRWDYHDNITRIYGQSDSDFLCDSSRAEAENYCRGFPRENVGPWCYTPSTTEASWEYCDIPTCGVLPQVCPTSCKVGTDYAGNTSVTKSGKTCNRWDYRRPMKEFGLFDIEFPCDSSKTEANNFCRALDHDQRGPWCYYATPTGHSWEYCDIPNCVIECSSAPEIGNSTHQPSNLPIHATVPLEVTCNPGYEFPGGGVRMFACVSINVWQPSTIPVCLVIECSSVPQIDNSTHQPTYLPINASIPLEVTCNPGFEFHGGGAKIFFCVSTDVWHPRTVPLCHDKNECNDAPSPCHTNATCTNTPGNYTCACHDGFSGDGRACEDIDECIGSNKPCHVNASCLNDIGSFLCMCRPGLSGDGRTNCDDIDECSLSKHNCHPMANCVNFPESFKCSCKTGYVGNGTSCSDDNECDSSTDACHSNSTCQNNDGSYACSCLGGFTGNGSYCENVNECNISSHDCHSNAICEDTVGNFTCSCMSGYQGNGKRCDNIDECANSALNNCSVNAVCADTDPSYNCACKGGYSDDNDNGFTCLDTDECYSNNTNHCNQKCINEPGSYHCECNEGFSMETDQTTCTDKNECTDAPRPCHTNASCTNTPGNYTCVCHGGFSGDGRACKDIDECIGSNKPCHVNASCLNDIGSFLCRCRPGLSGDGRTTCDDIDECTLSKHNCHPMAKCVNIPESFNCSCKTGYVGNGTSCFDDNECDSPTDACHPNATCLNNDGSYACSCLGGFSGNGTYCENVNECNVSSLDCHYKAICEDTIGSFTCSCMSGYQGNGKMCDNIDECANSALNNCSVNAVCADTDPSYNCACKGGYSDDNGNGFTCLDIDECASNTTNRCNQKCANKPGFYHCECYDGFSVEPDQTTCTDQNECNEDPSPCHTNATCTNTPGNYTCDCHVGFSGDGRACEDIDECIGSNKHCHVNASCLNDIGSFLCICRHGLSGDGLTNCNDIDECTLSKHNCHPMANCVNIPGSFDCSCKTGYVGNGTSCFDVDECDSHTYACHSNATCLNNNGSYACSCSGGFSGNGTYCENDNECNVSSHACHPKAICEDTIGNFTCSCISGYQGNGKRCVNIDECANDALNNCSVNAVCADTDPSYNCTCQSGYSDDNGNGFTCLDIDECASHNTYQCNQKCINEPGSYHCKCNEGFSMEPDQTTCTVITCSTFPTVLESLNNGSAVNAFYNDKVSFVCNTGYAVSAGVTSQTITCTGINTWTPPVKNCEAVKCLSPDRVLFSTMTESKAEFSYLDQLTYSCDPGFDLAGVATLVCQADNTWSSKEPVCAVGPTSLIIHDDDGVYNNAAVTIETGTEATLTCLTDNVLPSPVIQWRSGIGDQSAINQISPDPKTGSSKFMRNITLTPLMVNNGDRLVCSAYNSLLTGVNLTSTVVLNVVINGQWSIWGAWTKCTASCDYGTRQRRRWCSNPAPSSNGGKQCPNYPSEFEACYGYYNLSCKNLKDQEESNYLIANVVDKQESSNIMLYAFSVLGITGIAGFIWYMRDNYKRQAKTFRLTAMDEFDGLIKRMAQLLQEDEDEGDGKDAHLDEEAILERSRDIVKQKIRELQKCQPDEKPTAFTIEHFFKACNEIVVKDTKEDNPVVTTQPEPVEVTFDNENATIHMKNEILKRVLRRENKSLNRIKIEKALNDYIAFNKMHKTKLELDRTLLKQTNKIVLITALRSLLLIALNNEDINSLQRIIGSIEAKGATVYMSAEVEEAKTKLQALLAIGEVKHALCKMDRMLIDELKGYKYPPPHVHEVMVAALLILGENEIVTRDWDMCHNLCSSLGTAHSHGLYNRITHFKSDKLHPGIAARALEILHHCNENEIKASSAAATHFYYWTKAVAEEKVNKVGADVTPITGRRQVQILNRLFNIRPVKHTPKRMSAAKRARMRKIADVPEIVIHDPSEEDVTDQEDTVSQNKKEELERQAELIHKREEIQEVIDLKSMGLSLTDVAPPRRDTFVFDDFSF